MEEKEYAQVNGECSMRGAVIRNLIGTAIHVFNKSIMERERKYSDTTRRRGRLPKGFIVEQLDIAGIYAEMIVPERPAEGNVILLLHGGAYYTGYNPFYRQMAAVCSKLSGNTRVLAVDYRLAPEHPYPAALEDALSAYDYLVNKGYSPSRIIFAGDSAGGGLSLAAAMALRDKGRPLPGALVMLSPWTDLAGEGKSRKEKYEVDPMFGKGAQGLEMPAAAYAGPDNLKNPYVSPVYGSFDHLPPMLIHCGDCEMLLSDSETVAEKAREAGIPVEFTIWKGMFHVFQMCYPLVPEAKRSIEIICRFIKEKFEQAAICSESEQ